MTVRFQRLIIILLSLIFLSGAIILILINSKNNLVYFFTPTELINFPTEIDRKVRIGGFVKSNSLKNNTINNTYSFIITDNQNDIKVEYKGILPDLFRENQGAVIEGALVGKKKIKMLQKCLQNMMKIICPLQSKSSLNNQITGKKIIHQSFY